MSLSGDITYFLMSLTLWPCCGG